MSRTNESIDRNPNVFKITQRFDRSTPFGPDNKFFLKQSLNGNRFNLCLVSVVTTKTNVIPKSGQLKFTYIFSDHEFFCKSFKNTIEVRNGNNFLLFTERPTTFGGRFTRYVMCFFHRETQPPPSPAPAVPSLKQRVVYKTIKIGEGLATDLKRYQGDEDSKDVVFKIGLETVKAHKQILSARSEVFNRMFSVDMIEKRDSEVTINDMSVETVKSLLDFIYSNECQEDAMDEELMYAAEKYEITELKETVARHLTMKADDENALELLVMFDQLGIGEARKAMVDYVTEHKKSVLTPEKREDFQEKHPKLAFDVYAKLCFD